MKQFTVNTHSAHYAVIYGRSTLARVGAAVSGLGDHTGVFLLSSPRVWKAWGAPLAAGFREFGGAKHILLDDREPAKSLRTVEDICRRLVRAGADRHSLLVALGGGVVGDLAGFVAASYLRGVGLVQVPTTLVAQVDSAIGGKTGVNLPEGKNLVGAFYQPRAVVVDPEVLRTLPARQYRSGLHEVIKYGVIGDEELIRFLERRMDDLLGQKPDALDWVLPRCIRAKAGVVSQDEREQSGARQVLNLGHTVGHALEAATGYTRFLHGEAVGWGMIAACAIAIEKTGLSAAEAKRIRQLVRRAGPLPALGKVSGTRLRAGLRADKKARGGRLRFVLPRRIGQVEVVDDVPEALVLKVIEQLGG